MMTVKCFWSVSHEFQLYFKVTGSGKKYKESRELESCVDSKRQWVGGKREVQ